MAQVMDVRMAANGRLVLPKAARAALGLEGAGVLAVSVDGDEVKLISIARSVAQAQALYRDHVSHDQTSDDFLAERRREADYDPL
jgi:bifunctional DNA-binding transcriptional regulator/antitoxin component of YhaV-PrlF toxin-antitoxin module